MALSRKIQLFLIPLIAANLLAGLLTYRSHSTGAQELQMSTRLRDQAVHSKVFITEMSEGMNAFLLDPRNLKARDHKKQADESYVAALGEMRELTRDPETLQRIRELGEFDEKQLNPVEDEVLRLTEAQRYAEARQVHSARYVPIRESYNKLLEKVLERVSAEVDSRIAAIDVAKRTTVILIVLLTVIATGVAAAILWILRGVTVELGQLAGRLVDGASAVASAAQQTSAAEKTMLDAKRDQSAALQQTVAAVDQIGSMITRNAATTAECKNIAAHGTQTAESGKSAVVEMVSAIQEIGRDNERFTSQIKDSNEQVSSIVDVINEIASKARVINDIVFQTKLLSFNASVEAARAGENGRGFAVVAEEVGKLAKMSGRSAEEITKLLGESTQKVSQIVSLTRERADALIVSSQQKVREGIEVSERCNESLQDIVLSVNRINSMVAEISSASEEQANGVQEITRAMNRFEEIAQNSSRSASQSANAASDLSGRSYDLYEVARRLRAAVLGRETEKPSASKAVASEAALPATEYPKAA